MNFSEKKLLGQGGEGSNCLGEGFSKFDYNGSVVSISLQLPKIVLEVSIC